MTTNHAVRRLLQMDATRPGVGRACQEMLAELTGGTVASHTQWPVQLGRYAEKRERKR